MKKPKQLRIETRGPKDGICNLCGRFGHLTADHIPPKGVIRPKQVEIMYFSDMLQLPRSSKSSRYLQDGVKYKTLCNECNSGLLGNNYDPTLIKFSGDIRLLLD